LNEDQLGVLIAFNVFQIGRRSQYQINSAWFGTNHSAESV
jgi:hypothetical protein